MSQVSSKMRHQLEQHINGYSLEQPFYNNEDYFQQEMKHMFRESWLFAGLTCEIPEPGNYFTAEFANESIIVVRGMDGNVRAMHNSCRHRGSRVCLEKKGKAAKLVCPYHQWAYDLDGSLLFARFMEDDFDPSQHGLVPVKAETIGGYIFISLSESPEDFEQFRREVEPYMLPHDFENAKVAHESTLIEKANWKLVIENNRECYHCIGSHPELIRSLQEYDDVTDPRVDQAFVNQTREKAEKWEKMGVPFEPTPHNLRYRAVRMPLLEGALTMTMDGKAACTKQMGSLTDTDLGSMRMLHLPNTWNHSCGDYAMAFRVMPISAQETMVTTKWLVNKEAVEGRDYDIKRLTEVWKATNEQDKVLAENNQLGVNSSAYQPGPYCKKVEFGVINFIQWYKDSMLSRLPKSEQPRVALAQNARRAMF